LVDAIKAFIEERHSQELGDILSLQTQQWQNDYDNLMHPDIVKKLKDCNFQNALFASMYRSKKLWKPDKLRIYKKSSIRGDFI